MKLLEEIRDQPESIRVAMFLLCCVSTISLAGMVWFDSFQRESYAILNPGETYEDSALAQYQNDYDGSPFAFIGDGVSALRAGMYSLLDLSDDSVDNIDAPDVQVHMLPLSEDKW